MQTLRLLSGLWSSSGSLRLDGRPIPRSSVLWFRFLSRWLGRRSVRPGPTELGGRDAVRAAGSCRTFSEQGPHFGDVVFGYFQCARDSQRSKLLMRVGSTESAVIARSKHPGASQARVTWSRMTATASSRSPGSTAVCPAMISMRKSLPSRRREVGEEDHSGFESLHVVELHPDGSSVAEHVDVSLAPYERVQVHLVLVDQAPLGEGVRGLAAPVHEQLTVDLVLQLRDRFLEVPREQGRVPLEISGQGVGHNVLRQRVDHVRPLARLARPVSRQTLVGLATQHQPAGSRLTLERVVAVVCVRLHPLADRVYHAVDGGLRGGDQLSHLDSPSAVAATITKLQGRSERRVTSVAPLWLVSTMKV